MEPNFQQNPEPTIQPVNETKPKKTGSLTMFLSISLILISIIAGFFAWQNQKLVKNLREQYKTPIPVPSPTPTPLQSPGINSETANWKEYKVKSLGLTFKAPFEMNVDIAGSTITIQSYPISAPPPDNFYKTIITVSEKAVEKTDTLPPTTKNKETTDKIIETFEFSD